MTSGRRSELMGITLTAALVWLVAYPIIIVTGDGVSVNAVR